MIDIKEDIFFRKDNFKYMPWYNELLMFCAIGVCQPEKAKHIKPIREALSILGFKTRIFLSKKGSIYISGN